VTRQNFERSELGLFEGILESTESPIQWVPGVLFPRVKRPGREADLSPPSGAEVKNSWSYTSTPHYVFVA
jgi:hypothetical protein